MKPIAYKKYLKLYDETAKLKIMEVLFKYSEKEFSLSDLAREAGVAKANIGNILEEFQKIDLITIEKLSKIWKPENSLVLQFWNQLDKSKAMHDVLAAILFTDKNLGIWEQAKPMWVGNKMTTIPTTEEIYTLIGVKL
jgi:DNA-binding IclR family transcriptional regulator